MARTTLGGPLTRRELLRRGLVVATIGAGAPTLLLGCGDDDGGGDDASPTTTGGSSSGGGVPAATGTINYLSWEGYDIPDPMAAWKESNGVELAATYIGNHDDIQARLAAARGEGGFDLITYYQGYKPLYAQLEIIQPIDEAKIPNLANLFPLFAGDRGNFWVDADGKRTGVPWTWGSIGITYDESEISEPPTSYEQLFDSQYEGRLALPDDPAGSYTLAAHILGFQPDEVPKDRFEEIQDYLRRIVAQSQGVSPSFGDVTTRLVAGDAVIAWQGWAAVNQFAADAGKDTIKWVLPEEGGFSFCDAYAIPPGSDNVDTVHAWINESLDPAVNAAASTALVQATTVTDSVGQIDEAVRGLYGYEDLEGTLEQAPFYNNPPVESDEFVTFDEMIQAWQEIKVSS